ncbi:MAG: penicillin-binding transpeptidase domain-containing protein [Eubacteriales bacterium]|nr:penicillin-binding transpeptidase domain-containing protein [Eubacteriales bacterium]
MNSTLWRITLLRIVALVIVAILIYNLFQIQVIDGEKWANVADNNRFRHLIELAPRGRIYSADGLELAASIPTYVVALADEQNKDRQEQTITKLAEFLQIEPEEIRAKLKKHRRKFEPAVIATNVDFDTVLQLEEYQHLMPSLVIQVVPQRYYPEGDLLANPLGRVNEIDRLGVEGLERKWDDYLQGTDGFSVIQVNVDNRPVGDAVSSTRAVPGDNLHLTIDPKLQRVAQESLRRVLEKLRTERKSKDAWAGAVVVMDPNTGKILALVSEPTFDNNHRYDKAWWAENMPAEMPDWAKKLTDRTYQYRRTVGSTFKMVVGMAGLETGTITASEKIYAGGRTRINNQPVNDYGFAVHGNVDMRRALAVSSNIYFGTVGSRLGSEKIYEYIEKFGMSREQKNAGFDDIALDEQSSSLDYRVGRTWVGGHTVQISYGQLNEFTALQMANYVAMLANGGIHYKPYLVERISDYTGETIQLFDPVILDQQNFKPENLKVIREGMQQSASRSQYLKNLPFAVAGKTGSAEHDRSSRKNPERWRDTHSWWVGYAPYDNPEIAIVVFMEYAGAGSRGTEVARDIIDYYFGLEK